LAAEARPPSTLPATVVVFTIWPALSCARSWLTMLPSPGRIGFAFHLTFSCAAAWIASYSFGATTARRLLRRTIFTFGRCLIELASTDRIVYCVPYAPWPRGLTMRACTIPGTRTLCA
jgi:hypothetical protein